MRGWSPFYARQLQNLGSFPSMFWILISYLKTKGVSLSFFPSLNSYHLWPITLSQWPGTYLHRNLLFISRL